MTTVTNNAQGGSNGVTVTQGTAGNSGGTSGTPWDTVSIGAGAGIIFDSTTAAHGGLSYKFTTGATAVADSVAWAPATVGAAAQKWFRIYLYLTAYPAANASYIRVSSGANYAGSFQITPAGFLSFQNSAFSTIFTGTHAVPLNAWFRLEGYITGSATAGQAEFKLFTSLDSTTATEINTSAANLNTVGPPDGWSFGSTAGDKANFLCWIDDLGVTDSGYLGPSVAGTTTAFPVTIGKNPASSTVSECWQGELAQAAVYSFALSDAQIQSNYQLGSGTIAAGNGVVQQANASAASVTLPAPVTAGNTVILIAGCYGTGGAMTSSNPLLGGAAIPNAQLATSAQSPTGGGFQNYIAAWLLPNLPGGSGTISITFGNATAPSALWAMEVAGLGAAPVLINGATGTGGAGTSVSLGPFTVNAGASFTVAAATAAGTAMFTGGPPAPWTGLTFDAGFMAGGYIVSAGGPVTFSAPSSQAAPWAAILLPVYAAVSTAQASGHVGGAGGVRAAATAVTPGFGTATLAGAGSATATATVTTPGFGAGRLSGAGSATATALLASPGYIAGDLGAGGGIAASAIVLGSGVISFPGQPPNPLGVKVELNLGGTWTDITQYTMLRDAIQITNMGRVDESGQISASQLALTLKNDGRFAPENTASPYYPWIMRGTPVRLSVHTMSSAGVTYSGYRYFGEVASWPVSTNVSGRDNYLQIQAGGIWRRLSRSSATIGSSYTRYLTRLSGFDVPASAWAMEDGTGASGATPSGFVTTVGGGGNATFTGTPSFAADSVSFPGADALPQLNGARITATVASAAAPTDNVTRYALSVPKGGDSNAGGVGWNLSETDSAGTVAKLEVFLNANGTLHIVGLNAGGGTLFSGVTATNVQGVPLLVSAELTSGTWALRLIKPNSGAVLEAVTGGYGGTTGAVSKVILNRSGVLGDTTVGQLGVFYDIPSLTTAAAALGGHVGEFAVDRFVRLCAEESIASTVTGVASAQMGPQADDTLTSVLQAIEDTDGGLLYETRDKLGLGYRTLGSMMNQSPAVTLDYLAGQLGATLTPTYDDQLLTNQWTVTNWDGYVAVATLDSGQVSVQPWPNGAGLYAGTATTTAASHAQVNAIALHKLLLGTVDDNRYPTVTFEMARAQAAPLFAVLPNLRLGDYLVVNDIPVPVANAPVKQLVLGYSETLTHQQWTIVSNCIPEAPFETGYNPGTFTVAQAASTSSGGVVSGSGIGAGAVGLPGLSTTITARGLGGSTSFVSATVPYDWTFNVTGTPADATYFIATEQQVQPIVVGDTFSSSGGFGGPFTVTSIQLDPGGGGLADVSFTPDATSVMSSGTVFGGKNGDIWINAAAGNQVEQWLNGQWVAVQFGPQALSFTAGGVKVTVGAQPSAPATGDIWFDSANGYQMKEWNGTAWVSFQFGTTAIAPGSVTTALLAAQAVTAQNIAATTITAGQIAAGTITGDKISGSTITGQNIAGGTITAGELAAGLVFAGIVNGTLINGVTITGSNFQGSNWIQNSAGTFYYSSAAGKGNLIASITNGSGFDAFGNVYVPGSVTYTPAPAGDGTYTTYVQNYNGSLFFGFGSGAGFSEFYSSGNGTTRLVYPSGLFGGISVGQSDGAGAIVSATSPSALSKIWPINVGDPNTNTVYRITAAGNGFFSETLTFVISFGGATMAQVNVGASQFTSGTNFAWRVVAEVICKIIGTAGTASASTGGWIAADTSSNLLGGSGGTGTATGFGRTVADISCNTAAPGNMTLQANWSSTVAGPSITCRYSVFERIAGS